MVAEALAAAETLDVHLTVNPRLGRLGAKHMVTGYDHLLFLFGVIFFLYKMKDIGIYVTLFAIGYSTTMLAGVYFGTSVSSYLIDAIIGLSVVYKALDNMGAYERWFGFQQDTKAATLIFGFGLATKIQEFDLSQDGQLPNLLAFNVGVAGIRAASDTASSWLAASKTRYPPTAPAALT